MVGLPWQEIKVGEPVPEPEPPAPVKVPYVNPRVPHVTFVTRVNMGAKTRKLLPYLASYWDPQ